LANFARKGGGSLNIGAKSVFGYVAMPHKKTALLLFLALLAACKKPS